MEEKIAGHPIPKWEISNQEVIADIMNNIENKSQLSKKIEDNEKARQTRTLAGVCNVCRVRECLCHEGQK